MPLNKVKDYILCVRNEFSTISPERKEKLAEIADFISQKRKSGGDVRLLFICTHNSRRSQLCQVWAQAAAGFYNISKVFCFSGGTEVTAFHKNAVKALEKAGFDIQQKSDIQNPEYEVCYDESREPIITFSKTYFDEFNPQQDFIAIPVCSSTDKACPHIPNAEHRIYLPYEDPKIADNTPEQESVYGESSKRIASEMIYLFSKMKP